MDTLAEISVQKGFFIAKTLYVMLNTLAKQILTMTLEQLSCSMRYNLSTDDFTIPHSSRSHTRIDSCEKTWNDNLNYVMCLVNYILTFELYMLVHEKYNVS